MRCIFDASKKVIRDFNSKVKLSFWKVVNFAVAVCKSELIWCLYYKFLNSFHLNLDFGSKYKREKIYCDFSGKSLNSWITDDRNLYFLYS